MKILSKIISGLIVVLVLGGLGSGAVAIANNKTATEEFKVTEILKLPGQSAPKFLEDVNKKDQTGVQAPIVKAIIRIVDFAIMIIGSFAFLVMVAGGVVMLTSGGNDQQAEQGKNMLIYSIIGVVVALSSFIISAFVQSLITGT